MAVASHEYLLLPFLQVDVDLSKEGGAGRVSRQQARLALRPDGAFLLTNVGRRRVRVNNAKARSCWRCLKIPFPVFLLHLKSRRAAAPQQQP